QVTYGNVSVNLGNESTPTQVKDKPSVTWSAVDGAYYLLCMNDPDAPTRENRELGEVLHWLVGNIPGNKIHQGDTLAEFIGSGPPKDSGFHRYVFLVYKQPGKITFDEPYIDNRTGPPRLKFSTKQFAKKYSLDNPVAGNFYQAQYDDYVLILHAQLK
ncbi:Protein D1, partial [Blattella germanica]